jgi:hypothetical protein
MPDGPTYLSVVLGFAFVLIAGAWLAPGSPTILGGLFAPQAARDWPIGVQEPDAHLDALRPDEPVSHLLVGLVVPSEIVEHFERRLIPSRNRLPIVNWRTQTHALKGPDVSGVTTDRPSLHQTGAAARALRRGRTRLSPITR